jgi:flagellar hook-associated protein 1 FlgK
MSLDSALLIATSGLRHASRQMATSSQNVANAAVEGYTRKLAPGAEVGSGGVRTLEMRRDVDEALRAQARSGRSAAAAAKLRDEILAPLAAAQGDPADGASLGGLVGRLRDSLTTLRASPSDTIAQSEALRTAESLAGRLNEAGRAVTAARQGAQDSALRDVDRANGFVRDIARLDAQVTAEIAAGRNGDALRDQRDLAVSKLSELLDVTPVEGQGGSLTLILRGGSVLPLDPVASPLAMAGGVVLPDSYSGPPAGTLPGLSLNGRPLDARVLGGRIGEALAQRDGTLARMGAEFDTLASAVAQRLSEQGLTLFTEADGSAPPSLGSATTTGFASRITVSPEVQSNPAAIRDGTSDAPGFPFNTTGSTGFTGVLSRVLDFAFGGQRAAGIPHTAIPSTGLGPAGNLTSSFSAPLRLTDYAAAVSGAHAAEAAAASEQSRQAGGVADRLALLVQGREGVDVDKEMANMVTLQNAYAANARLMGAVQGMWDALLAAVR